MIRKTTGYFITGTNTDIGKTFVTCALAAWLRKSYQDVGVFKPVMSGITREDPASDVSLLARYSEDKNTLEQINPYQFDQPLAPGVAGALSGRHIAMEDILARFGEIAESHRFFLVEGAGGIYVPCGKDFLISDLAVAFQLPVLVVASPGLGTINHTLLTIHYLKSLGLSCAGIILNGLKEEGLAEKTNPAVIEKWSDVPVWGVLPWLKNPTKEDLCQMIDQHIIPDFKEQFLEAARAALYKGEKR